MIPVLILAAHFGHRSWRKGLALVRFSPRQLLVYSLILLVYLPIILQGLENLMRVIMLNYLALI